MKTSDATPDVDRRAADAKAKAADAYARLIQIAETRHARHSRHVAEFVAATYNGSAYQLNLFDLRTLDIATCDDVLTCIDALRWGKPDLYKLVTDGEMRVRDVIDA